MDDLKVFTGNAHPLLAKSICDSLGIPLGQAEVFEFSNENIFVRILENVRERDIFVVQPLCRPVNKSLVELLIILDALKRASAKRITAVMPYYGYGRTDKKDQPRVPITARLIADLVSVAGANRVLTVDLHAAQIQGFFNMSWRPISASQNGRVTLPRGSMHLSQSSRNDVLVTRTKQKH
jgi:ribose-phosphate pyrophosphokinase